MCGSKATMFGDATDGASAHGDVDGGYGSVGVVAQSFDMRELSTNEEETQPPPTFGQYDQYLVMHQLGKLAEPKLKPLLEEHQWKLLEGQIQQYKGMEQFLIQNGLIPKEDEELKARVTVKKRIPVSNQQADAEEPENQTREKPVPCPDP